MPQYRVGKAGVYCTLRALALSFFTLCFGAMASAQTAPFQLSGVQFSPTAYLQEAVVPYLNRPIAFADVEAMGAVVLSYAQPFWIGRDSYWTARTGTSHNDARSNLTGER